MFFTGYMHTLKSVDYALELQKYRPPCCFHNSYNIHVRNGFFLCTLCNRVHVNMSGARSNRLPVGLVYILSWVIFKTCLPFSLVMDQDYESRLLRQINIQENASPVVS